MTEEIRVGRRTVMREAIGLIELRAEDWVEVGYPDGTTERLEGEEAKQVAATIARAGWSRERGSNP